MAKVIIKLKKGVKTVAQTAKRKTKRLTEAAKLRLDIKMEESNLEHCFEMLGRAVYMKNEAKVDTLLLQAEKISNVIKEYKTRLADIQEKEICPHCESVITRGFPCEYCSEKIVANKKSAE